ncbi:acetyltransferase [Flavobacterium limnosediminis JC2902]|uniref:Acetyltransferase n=1 Tax=Flavobacterium limnosediminis JC2902 TaxID=1341181 RepID=V6SS13_9FLAO|nr:GNAT family N-acetyltransferase [Flavobacterium limnosediminis]ESU29431.1 acetyltransferase [Flavobacterium limnosediminis JC2902]
MILIRQIEAEDTFSVRQPVLRPGKSIESCHFEGDNLGTTAHFGLSENEELLAVVSLYKTNYPNCKIENQFQMRGMAVLEKHQRMGLGEQLVKKAEHYVREKNGKLIWFNAREKAVPFYEKLGYKINGNPFEINDIGTHFVMYKRL